MNSENMRCSPHISTFIISSKKSVYFLYFKTPIFFIKNHADLFNELWHVLNPYPAETKSDQPQQPVQNLAKPAHQCSLTRLCTGGRPTFHTGNSKKCYAQFQKQTSPFKKFRRVRVLYCNIQRCKCVMNKLTCAWVSFVTSYL